jgi:hypothetical protein
MLLFPESGPKKNLRGNGFTKTVTLHLRSIGPNVQRHMAYFALWAAPAPGSDHASCERMFLKEQVLQFTTNLWQTLNSHELFNL